MPPPRGNILYSNMCSSETTWPIKAKFYVKHLKDRVINVYINNPGHMTKMAARHGMVKISQKSSSPEPVDRLQGNLA